MVSPHQVAFYEHDGFLADVVAGFLNPGLTSDERALVIATVEHREAFEEALVASGVDVEDAGRRGQLRFLNAHDTLEGLLDGDSLPARFREVVPAQVEALGDNDRPVRIYGEMVALLWERGHMAEALELEDLWNELGLSRSFELLCGYPMRLFDTRDSDAAFQEVCSRHSAITNESYSRLGDAGADPATVFLDRV